MFEVIKDEKISASPESGFVNCKMRLGMLIHRKNVSFILYTVMNQYVYIWVMWICTM